MTSQASVAWRYCCCHCLYVIVLRVSRIREISYLSIAAGFSVEIQVYNCLHCFPSRHSSPDYASATMAAQLTNAKAVFANIRER
jgi:hypothetical protein